MSWQTYVDDQLIGSGQIAKALICGAGDGGIWANKGFKGEGTKELVNLYNNNPADAFAKGISIDGVKYMAIKADPRSIYGKKGATGIVCVKTNQCIIVGYYDEKQQPGNAANVCEKLGDYLIDSGY